MKSDPSQSSVVSRPQDESSTPDATSIAESTVVEGTDETTTASPSSSGGDTMKGGKKAGPEGKEEEKGAEKGSNLVGKITNLVSTDVNNIVDGRDFPMLFISLPLHAIFCIAFLYKILGWSALVGMATMILLYPLPGWLASKMQNVQKERMKMASLFCSIE